MKIILSRKGFDSGAGGIPSPILPDGTLLSLPIPDPDSQRKFSDIVYQGKTYQQIIKELNPDFKYEYCHLDPDLRHGCIKDCPSDWRAAFGQRGSALTHLKNYNVGIGDLFIFFGWFRQTKTGNGGKLEYTGADMHIIYGFMKIKEIIKGTKDIIRSCPWHPHAKIEAPMTLFSDDNNWLFIPEAGQYGVLNYAPKRILTKDGMSRTRWNLPDFFKGTEISYHTNDSWKNGYFQSVSRGQEFVISHPNQQILDWAEEVIRA